MLKVYDSCCKNCLLSEDSIVSPARRKDIIQGCVKSKTHFECHKATINGENIVCKTFYDKMGFYSQMIRIAQILGMVKFIPQPESGKLPTYKEMSKRS